MNLRKFLLIFTLFIALFGIVACDKNVETTTTTESTSSTQSTTSTTVSSGTTITTTTTSNTTISTTTTTTTATTQDQTLLLLEAAASNIVIANADNITTDFQLPSTAGSIEIVWESSNPEIIIIASTPVSVEEAQFYNVLVNSPAGSDETITLTATLSLNAQTLERSIQVVVKAEVGLSAYNTVSEMYSTAVLNEYIQMSGYVYMVYEAGYAILDSNGDGLIIYTTVENADLIQVGDYVSVKGIYAQYNTLFQLKDLTKQYILSRGNNVSVSPIILENPQDLLAVDSTNKLNHGKIYTITTEVYINGSGNVVLYDGETYIGTVYYNSNADSINALKAHDGEKVTIDVLYYVLYPTDGVRVVFDGLEEDIEVVPYTLEQMFNLDGQILSEPITLSDLFELPPLLFSTYDGIIISEALANNLMYDGNEYAIVRPSNIEGNVSGTLTITIRIGEETREVVVNVTIIAESSASATDLFISEYIEGGSYNKLVEIYNATNSAIDLSEYTLELYVCGSSCATTASTVLSLSGTLQPGQTLAVYNAGATADFKLKANINVESNPLANFNGDDTIVLKHNGDIIDSIGQIGTDPGDFWGDVSVSTKDMTLVRKPYIKSGDTNPNDAYDPSAEWIAYAKDTYTNVGTHTVE